MTRTPEAGAITYDGQNRAQTIEVQSGWRRVYDTANRLVWRVGPPNVHTGHDGPDLLLDFYLPDGRKLGTYQRFVSNVPAPPGETPAPAGIYFSRNEEHVYFGGRLIKTQYSNTSTTYTRQDRLGSTTAHYPYGEQRTASTSPVKFATYWHDHGGLQYAQNRYYSATYARFTTPDPYRASGGPSDPGSWNRYAYVVGDPINFNDPRGLAACPVDSANSVWVCDTGGPGGAGGAGSNDMQELPQGPFNDLTQIPGPGFVAFGIRLPHGNKYSAGQKAALQSGFSLAQLKIFDPDCIEAFGVSHSELLMTLRHTEYRVLDFGKGRRGSGAQTADTFSVHINATGIFFASASQISIPGQDAPDVRRMDPDTIRAFIFLHELGHQVGAYGPDTDLQINGRNSRRILDNCFRRGADGVYR